MTENLYGNGFDWLASIQFICHQVVMSKADVKRISDALGSDFIEKEVGVTSHAVRYARSNGQFPSAWFDKIESECRSRGIKCPRSAFAFRDASKKAVAS